MAGCDVLLNDAGFFVLSFAETTSGLAIVSEPLFKVSRDSEAGIVGAVVLLSIEAYRVGVADPEDMRVITQRIVRFTGERSWASLARNSVCVAVERRSAGSARVVPQSRAGQAFLPQSERAFDLPAERVGLGSGILKALEGLRAGPGDC